MKCITFFSIPRLDWITYYYIIIRSIEKKSKIKNSLLFLDTLQSGLS